MNEKNVLDSWKEISEYLSKDIRTCHRWEKRLGLPIHRYDESSSRSKVFAYKHEIDEWLQKKAQKDIPGWKAFLQKKDVRIILSAAAAVILISLGFYRFNHNPQAVPSYENLSLAVLPFGNPNPAQHEDYFTEGFTEGLITSLTRLNTLKIIPLSSVFQYRNSKKPPYEIGRELGAHYILYGNVSRDRDKFSLLVQLTRIEDQNKIWNQKYEDALDNLLRIRDSICFQIHEKILNKRPEKQASSADVLVLETMDFKALENFYIGNFIKNQSLNKESNDPFYFYHNGKHYSGKWDKSSNELAITYFEKALALDPHFAQAYLGLAECYTHYVNMHWQKEKFWLDEAEKRVEKAYSLIPDLPEYYSLLARIYLLRDTCFGEDTRPDAFEIAMEGQKKYPYSSRINSILGECYFLRFGEEGNEEDLNQALKYKEKAFEWNGQDPANITLVEILMLNREFNRALDVCNLINLSGQFPLVNTLIAEICYYNCDLQQSRRIFKTSDSPLSHYLNALFFKAMMDAQEGRRDDALDTVRQIEITSPGTNCFIEQDLYMASIYMGLGEKDLGYNHLENFFESPLNQKRFYIYRKYIDLDKNFDAVKSEKRFLTLIKRKEYKL